MHLLLPELLLTRPTPTRPPSPPRCATYDQKAAKLLRPGKQLPVPELQGDWNAASEEAAWKLHIHDLGAVTTGL